MTKQVSLSEKAYARLRASKGLGESFSDVVERLLDAGQKNPRRFFAATAGEEFDVPVDELLANIEAERAASSAPA